ncbi:MAG: hypothetical protein ACRD0L_17630, partial [Acidimicrobiales bacterium]
MDGGLEELTTEGWRPELADIDLRPTLELVRLVGAEDARVPEAVAAAAPAIAAAVDAIADRLARGGRLVYLGAGTAGRLAAVDAAEVGPTFGGPTGEVVALVAGVGGLGTGAGVGGLGTGAGVGGLGTGAG